uniref:Fibronectin type-III domain-containing protein n=1 Tax=Xiphophorus maculatus TaxID=8083 RepID=A0A3B5QAJ7_XIPMA
APAPPEILSIRHESAILTWADPKDSGGSPITDPPGPPSNPRITETTKTTAAFAWGRPHYDGGLEVEGYIVEYKKEGHDDWETETQYPVKVTEYVIGKLQKGGKYHFRVSAVNSEGVGEPAEVEKVTELVYQETIPDFELDAELRKTLVVRCRASIRLFVPIKGRPVPEVTWSKENTNLKARAHIDTTESYTLLVIPDCTRYDAGKYHLSLENVAGKKSGFVNVKVLDTPGPPVNLKPREITKNSITLQWEIPIIDGGSKIHNYIIEKRDATKKAYTVLNYTVTDLIEGAEYIFRIMAVNASGRSDPRESRPAVIKEQTSAPSFDLRGVYQKTVIAKAGDRVKVEIPVLGKPRPVVSWKKGDMDFPHNTVYVRAGSTLKCEIPLTGRPLPKVTLSKDNVVLKSTMRFNSEVTPDSIKIILRESIAGDSGRYDITASNSSGTTKSFVNIVVLDRPSVPLGPVELFDVTEESASLRWLPPAYDGGSPITNYIIQKRETTTANWIDVSSAVARCTIKVMKLTTGLEYQFRIRAENKYGISEHIDSPAVTVSLPYSKGFI